METRQRCYVCGYDSAQCKLDSTTNCYFIWCPNCGNYVIPAMSPFIIVEHNDEIERERDRLQHFFFYNKNEKHVFIGDETEFEIFKKQTYSKGLLAHFFKLISSKQVENWYPRDINEKIDLILLQLNKLSRFDGDRINFSFENLALLCFVVCDYSVEKAVMRQHKLNQIQFIIETLLEMEYIKWQYVDESKLNYSNRIISLTAKGLARVYELQKTQVNNKKVFIAISFNPAIEKIYNAIDSAIRDAKCEVVSMKHRIHNKQIVPEMLRLIKESKILVMDISEPNFGAYYEAGYAQGLGKEVIFTCKSSVMKKDKFLCDKNNSTECELLKKYSKPHFDIAQKQILFWEDEADLTERLTEWIKYLVE